MPRPTSPERQDRLAEIFAARDRSNMRPTIEAFLGVLAEHPDDPEVLYEVGGSYDTAGEEETAAGYYERAIDGGLAGDALRRCLLQYGSTLRNLGRFDDSLAVFARARAEFPESDSLRVFEAFTLHESGRSDAAVATLVELIADRLPTDELRRYEPALRGNAAYLAERDARH
ncbi:tetratricopeptide repeat protein [Agromyces lapidis]|uniref:Tetratricopeptide repeat protein n=1 Tax=Agromyces lapidis TaxID=279574 RepID=A0ABV5SLC1_9MICO|nr:tetratricopeptide repeat protein [Agromyces lapidis]